MRLALVLGCSLAFADASISEHALFDACETQGFAAPEWAVYITDDMPTLTLFVLYSDGHVVYARDRDQEHFFSAQLSAEERQALLAGLPVAAFDRLPAHINAAPHTSDGATYEIAHFKQGKPRTVKVYGDLSTGDHNDRSLTPREYLAILDRFVAFQPARAVSWKPTRYQISYGYKYQRDRQVLPPGWPSYLPANPVGLDKRVFLDASRLDGLRRYMQTLDHDRYYLSIEACVPWDHLWKTF